MTAPQPEGQPGLTDDEQAALVLAQDAEMIKQEHSKWATLAERVEHGPSQQIAENFRDAWEDALEEIGEQMEQLDFDERELREKLDGGIDGIL